MAVNISSLNIDIRAHTAPFNRDIKQIEVGVQGFVQKSESAFGDFLKAGLSVEGVKTAAAKVGQAFHAVKAAVSESIEGIGELADVSARLQMPTEDLIAFRHGAGLAGVAAAELDNSLEQMVRRLGEVASGKGKATSDALARIGLDARALSQMSPAESFEQIAEAISQIRNPTEQAAAAYAIFGRQGQQLLNFLNEGSGGLRQSREEMERLGLAISDVDAAKVEAAGDAIDKLKKVFVGLVDQFTIGLAPGLKAFAEGFTDAFGGKGDIMRQLGEQAGQLLAKLAEFAPVMVSMAEVGVKLAESMTNVGIAFANLIPTEFLERLSRGSDVLHGLLTTGEIPPLKVKAPEIEQTEQVDYAARAAAMTQQAELDKAREEAAKADQKRIDDLMRKGEQLAQSLRLPDEIFRDSLIEAKSLLEANAITIETYNRAVSESQDKLAQDLMKQNEAMRQAINPDVGIALRGTQGGFSAERAADNSMKEIARRQEEGNKVLADIKTLTEEANRERKKTQKITTVKL